MAFSKRSILAAMILSGGCASTPGSTPTDADGVYAFQMFRGESVVEGTFSLGWTPDGYGGHLSLPRGNLELVEGEVLGTTLRLQFESYGVRLFMSLTKDGNDIRGNWRDIGGSGAIRGSRVSTAWNRDSRQRLGPTGGPDARHARGRELSRKRPSAALGSGPQVVGALGPTRVDPGVISTSDVEHNAALSPDGQTLFFTRSTGRWGETGRSTIYVAHRDGAGWSTPTPAPFSGRHDDSDAFVSADGLTVLFTSDRPTPGGSDQGADIWAYALDGAEPRLWHLGDQVNSPAEEYSPVLSASGRLYFASSRPGGIGQGDLYVAEPQGDGFGPPQNLGNVVNSPFGEWNLVVDPEESFLVFESSSRALNRSVPGDLYVTFREAEAWTRPVPLDEINTTGSDLMPKLTPDGNQLFYSSSGSLGGDQTDIFAAELSPLLERARERSPPYLVAASRSGHHLAVIDPQTLQIVRRIETHPGVHEVAAANGRAVAPEYGQFPTPHEEPVAQHPGFTEVPEGNTAAIVDVETGALDARIELPGCARAHGVHTSASGDKAWVSCEAEAAVLELDLRTHAVIRRWETQQTGSHRVITTHDDRYLTVANVGTGTVTVIDRHSEATTVLTTGAGSEGMDAMSDGSVWILASGDETIVQIDPASATIVRTLPSGGGFPISISIDEAQGEAWIAHMGPRAVDIVDLDTGDRRTRIEFDTGPLRVLVVPESRHAYVSLPRENAVVVVDRQSRQVVARIPNVMEVDGLAWVTPGGEGP